MSRTPELLSANAPDIKPTKGFAQTCSNRHSGPFANILIPFLKAFTITSLSTQPATSFQVLQEAHQEITLTQLQLLLKHLKPPFISRGKLYI